MSRAKRRRRSTYVAASDAALASAGGYRNFLGNPYTVSVVAAKSGSSGFVDFSDIGTEMTSTGSVRLLFTCAQGTSTQERIGRKLMLTSIQMKGLVQATNNVAVEHTRNRLSIVYDSRPTGALPGISEIYESAASEALTNENGFDRFQIIRSWYFPILGNLGAAANVNARSTKMMSHYIKLGKRGKSCAYGVDAAGVAGSIAGIKEGALYLVTTSNQAAGSGPQSQLNYRVRFRDVLK